MNCLKSSIVQSSRRYSKRYNRFKSLISPTVEESFETSLNSIFNDISQKKCYLLLAGVKDEIMKAATYNREVGGNPGGLIMLHSYGMLKEKSSSSQHAFVLAWAMEMLHSYNIFGEKQECRNSETNIQPGAAGLLRSFVYDMLEEKSGDCKDTIKLFDKGFVYGAIGNYLDAHIKHEGKSNKFSNFDSKTYETLCEYKTGYNSFKLPFYAALQSRRKVDKTVYDTIENIGSDLSKLYQMQNEYKDCFGEKFEAYRCYGDDIQVGKCTWLAVKALQRCTAAQRRVFNACYGSTEPAHVERIKLLYEQLKIPQLYREEEGALCESIMQRAEAIESAEVPLAMFSKLLDAMYQEKSMA